MSPISAKHLTSSRAETSNTREMGNGLVSVLLSSAATSNAFALFELTMRSGSEPPLHAHDERFTLFYILEGELEVHCDGEVWNSVKGDTVLLPPRGFHTYKVISPTVRFLALMQPGDGIEGFFEEVSRPVANMGLPERPARVPLEAEGLQALAQKYGFAFDFGS